MNLPTLTLLAALAGALPALAQGTYVEEARLGAPIPGSGTSQGTSVAIDGTTAVVGAPWSGFGQGGTATVYVQSAGLWSAQATLVANDGANGNEFGTSVALDGNTIAVGAAVASVNSQIGAGAVYVFTRAGSTWTLQQKLIASDVLQNAQFGQSVTISGDTLAVGAPNQNLLPNYPGAGATYVFTRTGGAWSQQARLVPGGNMYGARSGSAVALEGDSLLIGARTWTQQSPLVLSPGAVFEFARVGSTWTEVAGLYALDPTQSKHLGSSISLDGNRALVGAPGDTPPGHLPYGSAYVFVRSGGGWVQEQKLQGVGIDDQDYFGTSVGLEGVNAIIGAINANSSAAAGSGSVRWFKRSGSTWTEQPDVFGSATTNGDKLGQAVGISGELVIGGANYADSLQGSQTGEAYIWRLDPPDVSTYCTAKINSLGCTPSIGSSGTPSASSAAPFFMTCTQVISQKQGLMYYGYAPTAAPFQGGTMCVQPPTLRLLISNSGGNPSGADCSGGYSYDFNARIQGGLDPSLVAGQAAYGQFWMRDPGSASTTGLSNALRVIVQP